MMTEQQVSNLKLGLLVEKLAIVMVAQETKSEIVGKAAERLDDIDREVGVLDRVLGA
jgi:hypothetical protein